MEILRPFQSMLNASSIWCITLVYGHLATNEIATKKSTRHHIITLQLLTLFTYTWDFYFFLKPKHKFIDFNWQLASNFKTYLHHSRGVICLKSNSLSYETPYNNSAILHLPGIVTSSSSPNISLSILIDSLRRTSNLFASLDRCHLFKIHYSLSYESWLTLSLELTFLNFIVNLKWKNSF